jgi:hypothetical protein
MSIDWNYETYGSTSEKLNECKEVLEDVISRIEYVLREAPKMTQARASAYWLAHIKLAVYEESEYLGKDMFTLESAIEECKEFEECGEEE